MFTFQKKLEIRAPKLDFKRRKELLLFQRQAGLKFKNLDLLNLSFCHRSYVNESCEDIDNNEKLEFLGDSVLGIIASEYLYYFLQGKPEGELSKIKSFIVSGHTLSKIALSIKINNFVLIGKGEEYSGGRTKNTILADCMEAVIGAYYLDSGFKAARSFVLNCLIPEVSLCIENKYERDYKTLLQEFVQKRYKTCPKYKLVKKTGPDHDRTFFVNVVIRDSVFGPGEGKNKKAAEQDVARMAYDEYIKMMAPDQSADKARSKGDFSDPESL